MNVSTIPTKARPIFIFGCPRSGTSLLSRMIDGHPRISVPFESHLMNRFEPWSNQYGDLADPPNLARFVDDLLAGGALTGWYPQLTPEDILPSIDTPDFGSIFAAVMAAFAERAGKPRWGEKTPHHVYFWPQLKQWFPDAQVVHIVRDGRDVALSLLQARFGPKTVFMAARHWDGYLAAVERVRAAVEPRNFHEIRYEDLLDQSETVLRSLCAYLGEDYSPDMLSFHENKQSYTTDARNQANLMRPVLADNMNKWRRAFSDREIRVFEAVAGERLRRYGYETVSRQPKLFLGEALLRKFVEAPPKRARAVLKNREGQVELLGFLRLNARRGIARLLRRRLP